VEDNVDSADSLNLLLRLYGHDVQVARTGPTALEMASASRPDVVLLDIGLPGMDGYQVARRLRERPEFKNVMVCALTGYTPSEADRERQRQTGFDHYYTRRGENWHVPILAASGIVPRPCPRRRESPGLRTRACDQREAWEGVHAFQRLHAANLHAKRLEADFQRRGPAMTTKTQMMTFAREVSDYF
jgi:CheY-like chemotaxis protein